MNWNGNDMRQTKTGTDSGFRLEDVAAGYAGYELAVRAKGFSPIRDPFTPEVGALRIVLEPGHALHGRVIDQGGKPVVGARVSISGGRIVFFSAGDSTTTDVEGHFELDSLPTPIQLRISATGYSNLEVAPAPVDQDDPVEFTREPMGILRGQVHDASTGKPLSHFRVRLGFSKDRRPGDTRGTYSMSLGDPGLVPGQCRFGVADPPV